MGIIKMPTVCFKQGVDEFKDEIYKYKIFIFVVTLSYQKLPLICLYASHCTVQKQTILQRQNEKPTSNKLFRVFNTQILELKTRILDF